MNANIFEVETMEELIKEINRTLLAKHAKRGFCAFAILYFARKFNSTNIQIGSLRELKHLINEGILTEENFKR